VTDKDLSIEADEIEVDFEPVENEFSSALEELEKRCAAQRIEFSRERYEGGTYGRVRLSSGREKRTVFIWSAEAAHRLLSTDFEQYVFVHGYDAICSYREGTIECALRVLGGPSVAMSRLLGDNSDSGTPTPLVLNSEDARYPILTIGQPSKEFTALLRPGPPRRFSLTVSNAPVSTNDAAVEYLIRFSNSLFFQIEQLFGSTFLLERERSRRLLTRKRVSNAREALQYPRTEYDPAAISLYWYALSARGLPLLQYLAFYQVMEFYYPRYSNLEARKRLMTIFKDPTFRGDRDDQVDRVISALLVSRSGAIGDERSQLRAVIAHCIQADEMRSYLTASSERSEYFTTKSSKRFHRIPLANQSADIRNDVADRIYDLRCKIVHTKGDVKNGQVEMILPFSAEADLMFHEIDLVQFVAKSVLIASSASLN